MTSLDNNALLDDARLVVDYATRAGRLLDDALPTAIEAAERSSGDSASRTTTQLAVALNNAIRAISPMTLVELRAGKSPFDERSQKAIQRLQLVLCILAIFLVSGVAYFTEMLHQEDAALKAVQQVQDAHPLDKLNAVRKMAEYEAALSKQDSHYDEYHQALRELRDLQDRISGVNELLNSVSEPWLFGRNIGFSWPSTAAPYGVNDKDSSTSAEPKAQKASVVVPVSTAPSDICDPKSEHEALHALTNYPVWLQSVVSDTFDEFCFSTKLSLGVNSFNIQQTAGLIFKIRQQMALQNGWILPFLYGLLGSTVFLMRSLLDTRTPNIEFFPAMLRIALGGIAGIIIGWFWVPETTKFADISTITVLARR